jgi:Peptidase family M28
MELARVFQQHRDQLRRGLVLGFWTGHETGTMVGSSWFVDRHWDRLREHAVAYLQIDQPACAGTTRWSAASNAELKRFHQNVEQRLLGNRPFSWRRAVKNGDASFFGLGVPMLGAQGTYTEEELKQTALANLGWWHHSLENTIDKLDFDYMAVHLKIYASYVWELCTAVVLPFEFVSVAEQFIERLDQFAPAAEALDLAPVAARARAFAAAARTLDDCAERWRARYEKGEKDEAAADILNDGMKRLSRILIPLASQAKGAYGHDPYGYTPQGTMIPALYDVPRFAKLPDGEQRWMLETQLVRERNRVADALDDCRRLIDATLATLE